LATAAIAIPILLAAILYPSPWPFAVVVAVIGALGIREYAGLAFPQQAGERLLTSGLGIVVVLTSLSRDEHAVLVTLTVSVIGGLVWTLLARPDFDRGLRDLGMALFGILYIGLLLPHFAWLHGSGADGPKWVVFVIAVGMAGDTSGYFVGHGLGRRKLMPRVSPGKTVEGSLGILAGSLVAGAVCRMLFLPETGWAEVLLLCAVMAVLGQLGDLSESIVKRTFSVKESGGLFPGHGGVLDRVDSLLFPVVFLYYYVAFG
jgi:phosphatidate cytidylyltransferase